MPLPLTKERKYTSVPKRGHQGLNFNKFFDQWSQDFTKVKEPTHNYPGGKNEWLETFKGLVGNETELGRAAGRIKAIATPDLASDDKNSPQIFETKGPFVTGMGLENPVENGFLWHHTLGVPYLPGSSVKGMIRAWAKHWVDAPADVIAKLFGRDDKQTGGAAAGQIVVFDALPVKPVELYIEVLTPHIGDWRITTTPEKSPPADWISPKPIPFLAVKEGAEFQFALAVRNGASAEDLEDAYGYLEQALEWIGAGAKTAIGFGRFESGTKRQTRLEMERRERAAAEAEAAEVARNAPWIPSVGELARYPDADEIVKIISISETNIGICFIYDGDEEDVVDLSKLVKK